MMSLLGLVMAALCLGMSHGYRCEWPGNSESGNFIDNIKSSILHDCPGPLDGADRKYCCTDASGTLHCCEFTEFALTYIIIAVAVIAIISVVCCVISCCCCPCCFIYKRRRGNIV